MYMYLNWLFLAGAVCGRSWQNWLVRSSYGILSSSPLGYVSCMMTTDGILHSRVCQEIYKANIFSHTLIFHSSTNTHTRTCVATVSPIKRGSLKPPELKKGVSAKSSSNSAASVTPDLLRPPSRAQLALGAQQEHNLLRMLAEVHCVHAEVC